MDDQTDVNLTAGEEASISEPSTEETKATGEVETPDESSSSTEVDQTQEVESETEDTPKKGAQTRIRELNAKAKSAQEEAKSLREKLAELTGSVDPSVPSAPYTPQIVDGGEFTPEQYKQDVLKTATATVEIKLKQYEAVNRINNEAKELLHQYPELNPDSDSFNKELSDSFTETVMELVKANPYTASPKKIVERLMKPYQRAVTKEVGKVSENIAKQASQTALRPTGISTKGEKPDSELSIKELEAKYGIVNV